MLPHLIAWQKRNDYSVTFACEARFDAVFVGIETPELGALEAIQTLNRYGLEVVSRIILGLDASFYSARARATLPLRS